MGQLRLFNKDRVMDNNKRKIQRSAILIKCFMALVMLTLAAQIYDTHVIDFGAVAGAIGILSMLRGFLCSPRLLSMPMRSWLGSGYKISKESYLHFILAFILIVVSGF